MVRYWMHTGFLNVKGEKMSKSLGNFITIKELLKEYPAEVFRFFVLSTHYRSPIDFSQEILKQSQNSLKRIYKFYETINELLNEDIPKNGENDSLYGELLEDARSKFLEAMDNDFNTPDALSILFDFVRETNRMLKEKEISEESLNNIMSFLKEVEKILGFNFTARSKKSHEHLEGELIDILIDVRAKLRERKNWELSDEIRSRLRDLDINLEDK